MTPQRAQALGRIGDRQGLVRELALAADVSDGVIRGLVKAGAVEAVEVSVDDPFPVPDPDHRPPLLEAAQQEAARQFIDAVDAREFAPFLQIGRASCRERVCQYVSIAVVALSLTKQHHLSSTHLYTKQN